MRLVLLGAPGAGKGTQAEIISKKFNIPKIATGSMLREAIKSGSELGQKVKLLMDTGDLVPDNIIMDLIQERMAKPEYQNGYILDGMPRTIKQAEALEQNGVVIDVAIAIEVSDEEIINRMTGRRFCPDCHATYHVNTAPPKADGVCDKCGSELITRKDDEPETVIYRLKVYHAETEPLKEFYDKRGLLKSVGKALSIDETTAVLCRILEL